MIKGNKLSCEEEYFKSLSLYSLFRLQTIPALEPPLLLNAACLTVRGDEGAKGRGDGRTRGREYCFKTLCVFVSLCSVKSLTSEALNLLTINH